MCLCIPGQLFPRSKSRTKAIPRHKGLKKTGLNEGEKSSRVGNGFQEDIPRERLSKKGFCQERYLFVS